MSKEKAKARSSKKHSNKAQSAVATDLGADASRDIAAALNGLLADVYALYLKTKNFHWHVSGPHFRDYHLLFDEQAAQIFAMADPIAERIRKTGGQTLKSVGHIGRLTQIADNDSEQLEAAQMLAELCDDNQRFASRLRAAHEVCADYKDIASASLIENWIDETEQRTWFLFEAGRN